MSGKHERDYITKHEQIRNKLVKLVKEGGSGCFSASKIAVELGMDPRTVRAHLKILEVDNAGMFVDPEEKEFCTREGITLLAKKLGLTKITEQETERKD